MDCDDLLAAGELARFDSGKVCQTRLNCGAEKVALAFHLSDSKISGACASGTGCGSRLRVFSVRFRPGVEPEAGEANLVRVLFGCSGEADG